MDNLLFQAESFKVSQGTKSIDLWSFDMSALKVNLTFVILFSMLWVFIASEAAGKTWYAGAWDSTFYPLAEHPKTIATS